MAKRVSEYRRKWDERVPRNDIRWLSGLWHASKPEAEIADDIRSRCTAPGYTESLIKQSIDYALTCHKRNYALFNYAMGGR